MKPQDWVVAACQAKPGAVEDYPFGDEVAVFKVAGRIFALVPLGEAPGSVSLKCDLGLAVSLRDRYAGVTPGYHLNKRTHRPPRQAWATTLGGIASSAPAAMACSTRSAMRRLPASRLDAKLAAGPGPLLPGRLAAGFRACVPPHRLRRRQGPGAHEI